VILGGRGFAREDFKRKQLQRKLQHSNSGLLRRGEVPRFGVSQTWAEYDRRNQKGRGESIWQKKQKVLLESQGKDNKSVGERRVGETKGVLVALSMEHRLFIRVTDIKKRRAEKCSSDGWQEKNRTQKSSGKSTSRKRTRRSRLIDQDAQELKRTKMRDRAKPNCKEIRKTEKNRRWELGPEVESPMVREAIKENLPED